MACTSVGKIRLKMFLFFYQMCHTQKRGRDRFWRCEWTTQVHCLALEDSPLSGELPSKCCWSLPMQTCALNANSMTSVHMIINYMPYMHHMEEANRLTGFFFPLADSRGVFKFSPLNHR